MHCVLHTANVFTISTEMYNEIGTIFWYRISVTLIRAYGWVIAPQQQRGPSLPECDEARVGRVGAFNAVVKVARGAAAVKLDTVHDGTDDTDNSQQTKVGNDL